MVQPCELARRDLCIKTNTPLACLTKTLYTNILANAILSHTQEEEEKRSYSVTWMNILDRTSKERE